MTPIAAFYAELALALVHERQAAYRAEAEADRLVRGGPRSGSRSETIRAVVSAARAALSPVEAGPASTMPRLADYPYRG